MLRDVGQGASRVGGWSRAASSPRRGFGLLVACLAFALFAGLGSAAAPAGAKTPSLKVTPSGFEGSKFASAQHEYVVRCDAQTELRVSGAPGWQVRIGSGGFHSGGESKTLEPRAGKRTTASFRHGKHGRARSYDVRCLPSDFPNYNYNRTSPGGPGYFAVSLGVGYGAFFDRYGVPVWWYRASTGTPANLQVLADKTVAFDPTINATGTEYQITSLSGKLLSKPVGAQGQTPDIHDIQLLDNGNYLIGFEDHYTADTSAYGGSADAEVFGLKLEEVTPSGKVVWRWRSRDHIGLGQTGRWWNFVTSLGEPYDIVHWNAANVDGNKILLSFRHLDAVYAINRKSGHIAWKLGGTKTSRSLRARQDPQGEYPLGGQHDVRALPDGTVSIHDNATDLDHAPRAVRYRIDRKEKTATLVDSLEDPEIPTSTCCGSARLLGSGDWLLNWGSTNLVRSYDSDGSRQFTLRLPTFSYRAIPIDRGLVDRRSLSRAMDGVAKRGKAE